MFKAVQKFSKITFTIKESRMMDFLLIILLLMNGVHSTRKNQYAPGHRFNYVVSIQQSNAHLCTGTIIDKTHVLTVAHLFLDTPTIDLSVAGGGYNQTSIHPIKVKEIHMHPQLKKINIVRSLGEDWENDIAIIELKESIDYGPVQLTTAAFDRSRLPICYMITWLGHTRLISKQAGVVLRTYNTVFRLSPDQCAEERIRVGKNQKCFIDELQNLVITSVELGSTIVCRDIMVGFVVKKALSDILGTPSTFLETVAYSDFIHDALSKGLIDVQPDEFPYIVSISYDSSYICGGSVLDETHILTTASCVQGKDKAKLEVFYRFMEGSKVDAGLSELSIRDIKTYNDIAVLLLANPSLIELTSRRLKYLKTKDPSSGILCDLPLWKHDLDSSVMTNKKLRKARVMISTMKTCNTALESQGMSLPGGQFCAKNQYSIKVTDFGDSGNPLICGGKLVGILVKASPLQGSVAEAVFLEIDSYKEFISSTIAGQETSVPLPDDLISLDSN